MKYQKRIAPALFIILVFLGISTGGYIVYKRTLNCDNDWQCLISAANQCQPVSGTVSYSNVTNPFITGLLRSGRTKYEIKKSGNSCMVIFSWVSVSLDLSAEGRAEALATGSTSTELDTWLRTMNDSYNNDLIGLPTTCTASGSTIASYLSDQKNGITGEISFSGEIFGSSSQSTITTSSGQKITCTSQQSSTQDTD